MTNNDILRRLRYTLDFNDKKMLEIFALADYPVTREQISAWLKKEDDAGYTNCTDQQLANFLNGLITDRRGKKEGPPPVAEKKLTNNIVFRKLKIALDLQAEEVLNVIALAGLQLSKHELSAFFRRPDHKHYRECKDQVLRNFLAGLQQEYRPQDQPKAPFSWD